MSEKVFGHGGARPGAGRKRIFKERAVIQISVEERDKHRYYSMIDFMKEETQETGFSASSVLNDYMLEWMNGVNEEKYLVWAKDNLPLLKKHYPREYERIVSDGSE